MADQPVEEIDKQKKNKSDETEKMVGRIDEEEEIASPEPDEVLAIRPRQDEDEPITVFVNSINSLLSVLPKLMVMANSLKK